MNILANHKVHVPCPTSAALVPHDSKFFREQKTTSSPKYFILTSSIFRTCTTSQFFISKVQSFNHVCPSIHRYRQGVQRCEIPQLAHVYKIFEANLNINQLLNKDFYHLTAAALEVKSNTPNNVAFKVTGKSTHDNATSGLVRI